MLDPTLPPVPAPERSISPWGLGVLALAGSLTLFVLIGVPLQAVSAGAGIWFTELFLFFGWGWALLRWSGRDPVAYLGLRWPGGWPLLLALGLAVGNYFAVVIPLQYVVQLVLPRSWVELFDQTQVFERATGPELVMAVTGAVAAAPIGEEVIFRGLLLQGLLRRGTATLLAVGSSALVFGACHLNPVAFPSLLELGILFGLLYARTRSVLPGMVAHLGSNLTATLLYVAGRGQEATPADGPAEVRVIAIASAAGWGLLALLLTAARRSPGAWGPERTEDGARKPVPLARALLPWVIGGAASLLAWGLLDRRGIELDVADLQVRLPPERSTEPAWERDRRSEVAALREDARHGRTSTGAYLAARRALADALERPDAGQSPPDAGVP